MGKFRPKYLVILLWIFLKTFLLERSSEDLLLDNLSIRYTKHINFISINSYQMIYCSSSMFFFSIRIEK